MKKISLILLGVFGLLFSTNVYGWSYPNDFLITPTMLHVDTRHTGDSTNMYSSTYFLRYQGNTDNSWPGIGGRMYFDLGAWVETPNVQDNYFASYSYYATSGIDNGNAFVDIKQTFLNRITITFPHEQFCSIDKDCRIDTIFRFETTCNGLIQDNNTQYCRTLSHQQLVDVAHNFQTAPTSNHCSYKTDWNGVGTDLGLSCYIPKGQSLFTIDLVALDKNWSPIRNSDYERFWYAVNFKVMFPNYLAGDSITDLNEGGNTFDFFNQDYMNIIGNSNSFFNNFNDINVHGLTNVVLAPLQFIRSLSSSYYDDEYTSTNKYSIDVDPLKLNFRIFSYNIYVPSGHIFWNRGLDIFNRNKARLLSNFRNVWNILLGGYIIYFLAIKLYKKCLNAYDPDSRDEVSSL